MRAIDGDRIVKILNECIDKILAIQGNLEIADNPKLSVELQVYKDMLDEINEMPTIEPEPQIIHCNRCKHYQGVHNVQGHAPCNYWGTGAVLWNEYCSKAEPYREGEE